MTTTAVYARISHDAAGEGLGVQRQEQDCRQLAERLGWQVAEVYVDNDLSAYNGKARPAYERLCQDLKNGDVGALIAWHPDRLTRQPRQLEDLIDLIEVTGARVATVTAGEYDLSTPSGRTVARIVGAVARGESEHKSARQRAERAQAARAGKPHGGPRPFGYAADRVTPHPEEAPLVAEAARRVLAGESLRSVCLDFGQRGITAPQSGRPWTTQGLRSLLGNPRIAGLRSYRGEIIGEAAWPALVDRATWERLQATLPRGNARGRPATNLLTGLVVCGLCGAKLYVGRSGGYSKYKCQATPGTEGCGRLSITQGPTEEFVTHAVLAALDGPALAKRLSAEESADVDAASEELADCEARMADLAADFGRGEISRREWLAAREALEERAQAARNVLDRASRSNILAGITDIRAAWDAANVDKRRAILGAVLDRVEIHPATKRGATFDHERIALRWKV